MRIEQNAFMPAPSNDESSSQPLVVHGRPGTSPQAAAIFVHGWGGHRYGTWGRLPSMLFAAIQNCDLGLYGYASGVGRISRRSMSAKVQLQAEHLAHTIRDSPYRSIVLLGHSMGGLLSGLAIVNLIDSRTQSSTGIACDKIAGLLLCATPQAGITLLPRWLAWLSPDFRLLHTHSDMAHLVARRFSDRVELEGNHPGKLRVPVFALVGAVDRVVGSFSAGLSLPSDRIKVVMRGHRNLVKPTSHTDEGFEWLQGRLDYCLRSHGDSIVAHQPQPKQTGATEALGADTPQSSQLPPGRSQHSSQSDGPSAAFYVRAARDSYTANEMTVHHHTADDWQSGATNDK
jgi:pimeloyl-ACP methyl ester carboxylesterase